MVIDQTLSSDVLEIYLGFGGNIRAFFLFSNIEGIFAY